ncbi:MAG TPA: DUF1761 domain-containing protein [Pseudolabrys sp.]|jgi:hypothetical protein|nr:DUF1761 domain-containing protein [Pseudolabrys sp.]
MTFAGINYWAVLVAGVLGFGLGGVWYRLLAEPWKAAHNFTTEQIRAHHGKGAAPTPLIIALVADLIMAWMLAGLMAHLGEITVKNGVISALFVWFGFVATTLAVNNTFGMRSPKLILIDGGHWLAALLLMGAVIGAWGV